MAASDHKYWLITYICDKKERSVIVSGSTCAERAKKSFREWYGAAGDLEHMEVSRIGHDEFDMLKSGLKVIYTKSKL